MEKEKTVADDDIPQDSESKSDCRCQSSTPGGDSDHDYTVIDSSSPTHTEDRLVNLLFRYFLTLVMKFHVLRYV